MKIKTKNNVLEIRKPEYIQKLDSGDILVSFVNKNGVKRYQVYSEDNFHYIFEEDKPWKYFNLYMNKEGGRSGIIKPGALYDTLEKCKESRYETPICVLRTNGKTTELVK